MGKYIDYNDIREDVNWRTLLRLRLDDMWDRPIRYKKTDKANSELIFKKRYYTPQNIRRIFMTEDQYADLLLRTPLQYEKDRKIIDELREKQENKEAFDLFIQNMPNDVYFKFIDSHAQDKVVVEAGELAEDPYYLFRTIKASFVLFETLIQNNISVVFGYPGGAILPIYDELYFWEHRKMIDHILVRHEQGAAHAADGYARSTGEIGVCMATSGPGATNLVTGIATAYADSIPLLVITGQVALGLLGTDAFQEIDMFGMTLPIVKHSYLVRDPEKFSCIINEAIYIARSGRPGPVLIDVPKDIGGSIVKGYKRYRPIDMHNIHSKKLKTITRAIDFRSVLALIQRAVRPIFYIGGGVITANATYELYRLAKHFQLPVTNTLMGKGAFEETEDLSLGMLGMHGTPYANFSITNCDVLVAIGARFDDRVTGKLEKFACRAKLVHIDVDNAEIGKNKQVDYALNGDLKVILAKLVDMLRFEFPFTKTDLARQWNEQIILWKDFHPLAYQIQRFRWFPIWEVSEKIILPIMPQQVIAAVSNFAPDAFVTTDVGQHQMWAAQFMRTQARRWLSSAGLGTMGYGLPAAVGAQIANPEQCVICITGDSSFQMNFQELGTIAQYKLPIKIFVINNKWQGMVRQWQDSLYGHRYSNSEMSLGAPDLVTLAEVYEFLGLRMELECPHQINPVIGEALQNPGCSLVDCEVQEKVDCLPMLTSDKESSEMIGYHTVGRINTEFELARRMSRIRAVTFFETEPDYTPLHRKQKLVHDPVVSPIAERLNNLYKTEEIFFRDEVDPVISEEIRQQVEAYDKTPYILTDLGFDIFTEAEDIRPLHRNIGDEMLPGEEVKGYEADTYEYKPREKEWKTEPYPNDKRRA